MKEIFYIIFSATFILTLIIHLMKYGFKSFFGLSLSDILSEIFGKYYYFLNQYKATKKKRYLCLFILDKVKDVGWIFFVINIFNPLW